MDRHGISLIEVLGSIAILALVVAIAVPAVQSARESSRRAQCANHLKQMALGVNQYEALYNVFPKGTGGGGIHSKILPFIGQSALYDSIPKLLPGQDYEFGPKFLRDTAIPIYVCPSDVAPHFADGRDEGEMTSYAANAGTGVLRDGFDGVFGYQEMTELGGKPIGQSDIRGGMSQTAMIGEILHSDPSNKGQRLRVNWNTPRAYFKSEFNEFRRDCERIPPRPTQYGWKGIEIQRGVPWTVGNMAITMYTHSLPPNRPSCLNGSSLTEAISGSASLHANGANIALCDGHVQFFSNDTDRQVWEGFGSRN